jgi:hypothetical protein
MTTVWIYEKADTLMEFASEAEARAWLKANDPGGTAVECQMGEWRPAGYGGPVGVPRATERPSLRMLAFAKAAH